MRSILAEYDDQGALEQATGVMRDMGYTRIATYTPDPLEDPASRGSRSSLTWIVAALGVGAVLVAVALDRLSFAALTAAGDRPHLPTSLAPISFEMGVVGAGLAALVCVLAMGRLARLWHPALAGSGIAAVTHAGYWLVVDARDPLFEPHRAHSDVQATDPVQITEIAEPVPA